MAGIFAFWQWGIGICKDLCPVKGYRSCHICSDGWRITQGNSKRIGQRKTPIPRPQGSSMHANCASHRIYPVARTHNASWHTPLTTCAHAKLQQGSTIQSLWQKKGKHTHILRSIPSAVVLTFHPDVRSNVALVNLVIHSVNGKWGI